MSNEVGQSGPVTVGAGFLLGRFDHALDPKKRFTIPAGWRDVMGSPAYVYILPDRKDKCLNLWPPAEMEALLAKLRQQAQFEPDLVAALRVLGENSEQVSLDVQGRIRIRDRLLRFAMLEEKVVLIGAVNRVQLWSPALMPETEEVDQGGMNAALRKLDFL